MVPQPPLMSARSYARCMQVSPAFLMYFLQAELTMNECARRRKWVEHAQQQEARNQKYATH